jgi:hypothetical protein
MRLASQAGGTGGLDNKEKNARDRGGSRCGRDHLNRSPNVRTTCPAAGIAWVPKSFVASHVLVADELDSGGHSLPLLLKAEARGGVVLVRRQGCFRSVVRWQSRAPAERLVSLRSWWSQYKPGVSCTPHIQYGCDWFVSPGERLVECMWRSNVWLFGWNMAK